MMEYILPTTIFLVTIGNIVWYKLGIQKGKKLAQQEVNELKLKLTSQLQTETELMSDLRRVKLKTVAWHQTVFIPEGLGV